MRKSALRAPARLRRIGGDVLDAELRQGAADLGGVLPVDPAAGDRGVEIVAAAVGVERAEEAAVGDHLGERPEARGGALLRHQEGRADLARRVVERDHQVERRAAGEPGMACGVLVQEHARQRPPRPLAPVRPAPRRALHQPRCLQRLPRHRVAEPVAVPRLQVLVEVLHREALIHLRIERPRPRELASSAPAAARAGRCGDRASPGAPSSRYRTCQRRNVRSDIPSISAASACVRCLRSCRSSSSSKRMIRISSRTRARPIPRPDPHWERVNEPVTSRAT